MTELSIYIDRDDFSTAETEEKELFIKDVLTKIGIPLEGVWPEDRLETVEDKIEFRKLMDFYNVDILDDGDRGVKIYVNDDVIAEWKKPKYILRTDYQARRPVDRIFYEMIINFWSMFEGDDDE
jgi:hypothetical protein